MESVVDRICQELSLPRVGVQAAVALLGEGNTVHFIARYRKEATGSLDEVALRAIEGRVSYFRELLDRRATVLKSVAKSGALTPELESKIRGAWTKTELEDLYLPHRPKKRTKATAAKELGLESLLGELLADESGADPLMLASPYVKDGTEGLRTPSECLEGAGHILAERLSEDAAVRAWLRQEFHKHGVLTSRLREEKAESQERLRFKPYWDFSEPMRKMPPHRVLAIRRGEKENVLAVKLVVERDRLVAELEARVGINPKSMYRGWLADVCGDAFDRLLAPSLETDVRIEAKKMADAEAIRVFQTNLDNLLLAPPAGGVCTLGVDPGIRTGCKLAVINRLGQYMETVNVYPLEPKRDLEGTRAVLDSLAEKYPIETVAVGNGTGGRETEAVIRQWVSETGREGISVVSVSEAGASVYSASELAREEFPDLDLTARGAISIARRFQDPLAELVKIEPRSIGVGQYQHDVNQTQLKKGLDDSVASCVNRVGADLNRASYRLLSYISGIGESLAKNVVQWRYDNGDFKRREQLMDVPRFGERTFRQAAGFLRINGGENPLDASAVHPEAYPVVQRMCQATGMTVPDLIGNDTVLDGLDPAMFTDARFGVETVTDIMAELKKPGRDPRKEFVAIRFNEGVHRPTDLEVGMELQGIVTNVADFGAFVDLGVHQDGLVHLSEIAHRYIKRPSDVLAVGQTVRVKVVSVDHAARRIGLSIKALLPPPEGGPQQGRQKRAARVASGGQAERAAGSERPPRPERTERPGRDEMAERPERTRSPKGRQDAVPPERDTRAKRAWGREATEHGNRPDRPEKPKKAPGHVPPLEEAGPPPSRSALDELMARFNRGLR